MILFVLLLVSQTLWARNIVLLSSLPENQVKIEKKVDSIMMKEFGSDETYDIVIKHRADQEDLFNSLNDSQTHAVFWLSHGGYTKVGNSKGVAATPMLLDFQKDNVAKTFQKIHPHVKFVGVIGCNSKQILGDTIEARSDLDYYIPKRKVVAQLALKKAIRHFKRTEVTRDNSLKEIVEPETLTVKLTRNTGDGEKYKSLKVFLGGKLLTVLPKMDANSKKEFLIDVPKANYTNRAELKLIFESGQSPHDEIDYFGKLQLNFNEQSPWILFSKPTGEPFGTNERIFVYKGDPAVIR
jgi:hypothetical protein